MQLDAPGTVVEVQERGLALATAGVQAAGDAHAHLGLLAGFESFMRRLGLRDRRHVRVGVRERVDARLPQPFQLAAAGGEELVCPARRSACVRVTGLASLPGLHAYATSMPVTVSSRCLPEGSVTLTASPFLRPTSALPTGDSLESRFAPGSASVDPTIVYVSDLPLSSLTDTWEPTRTTSGDSSEASITDADRSLSSSVMMRDSSIACSFFASSYSEFSEMSPNSRASLMRSATSRRLVVERYSISCLSFSSPSGVRMTSFCMLRQSFWGLKNGNGPLVRRTGLLRLDWREGRAG